MNTSKVSQGQWIAGAGGIVLLVSLFLSWISGISLQIGLQSVSTGSANAFDVFSGMDIIMLIVAVVTIAWVAVTAVDMGVEMPANINWIIALLGVGTIGWCLGFDLENSNAGIGAWLGLAAALAITYGAFAATSRPAAAASTSATPPPSDTTPPPSAPAV